MEFYHFTSYNNLSSIAKKGLVPQVGDRSKSVDDDRKAVFFSYGIRGAIRMYSSMRFNFEQYVGLKGEEAIQYHLDQIKSCEEYLAKGYVLYKEETIREIDYHKRKIEAVKFTMQFNSLLDYLKEGCYLSVERFNKIEIIEDKDCHVYRIIKPSRINVVGLYNNETDEFIDSREKVLAHFMSTIPCEVIASHLQNIIEIKNLRDLYKEKGKEIKEFSIYNDYHIERIPITVYTDPTIDNAEYVRKR